MKSLLLALVLLAGVVHAEPEPLVPRRSYLCAALLKVEPTANVEFTTTPEVLAAPKAALERVLAPSRPKTLLRRFVAWLTSLDEHFFEDVAVALPDLATFAPDKAERRLVRRVLHRLRKIESEVKSLPETTFPMRNVLRGRDEIRTYLTALRDEATRLETDHPEAIAQQLEPLRYTPEEAAARRHGVFGRDLARGLFFTGLTGALAYAALHGWQTANVPLFVLGLGAGVGLGAPGVHASFRNLRVSFTTFMDEMDHERAEMNRRQHEERTLRAETQLANIDAMLAALDEAPATRVGRFFYHGYSIELPIRNATSFGGTPLTHARIIAGERTPDPYDPVLNRWVAVDQIFQFDDAGEPTLITFMSEQAGYGPTHAYDAWINDGGYTH